MWTPVADMGGLLHRHEIEYIFYEVILENKSVVRVTFLCKMKRAGWKVFCANQNEKIAENWKTFLFSFGFRSPFLDVKSRSIRQVCVAVGVCVSGIVLLSEKTGWTKNAEEERTNKLR